LTFDRPIKIGQLQGPEVSVNDFLNGTKFIGMDGPGFLADPVTVQIELEEDSSYAGSLTTLTATAATGIRAVDDDGTWPGVTDLNLPFP
jgi:hypothetical protein